VCCRLCRHPAGEAPLRGRSRRRSSPLAQAASLRLRSGLWHGLGSGAARHRLRACLRSQCGRAARRPVLPSVSAPLVASL